MVFQLPSPNEAGGAQWGHDWHSYDDYLTIHFHYMRKLEDEGLVELNSLRIDEQREGRLLLSVFIRGEVRCTDGIIVRVEKELETRQDQTGPLVRGIDYSYHAWIGNSGVEILRYDMAHDGQGLHCHVFDLETGHERMLPVTMDKLPTLDAFIRIAIHRVRRFREEH